MDLGDILTLVSYTLILILSFVFWFCHPNMVEPARHIPSKSAKSKRKLTKLGLSVAISAIPVVLIGFYGQYLNVVSQNKQKEVISDMSADMNCANKALSDTQTTLKQEKSLAKNRHTELQKAVSEKELAQADKVFIETTMNSKNQKLTDAYQAIYDKFKTLDEAVAKGATKEDLERIITGLTKPLPEPGPSVPPGTSVPSGLPEPPIMHRQFVARYDFPNKTVFSWAYPPNPRGPDNKQFIHARFPNGNVYKFSSGEQTEFANASVDQLIAFGIMIQPNTDMNTFKGSGMQFLKLSGNAWVPTTLKFSGIAGSNKDEPYNPRVQMPIYKVTE